MSGGCREFATNLLWQFPSVFSRLVFLGARRDARSGRYHDPMMASNFDEDEVHAALAELHAQTFALWMGFNQAQQYKDLIWYLHADKMSPRRMVDQWINSQSCSGLAPADVPDAQPFTRALAVLLLLISAEQPTRPHPASGDLRPVDAQTELAAGIRRGVLPLVAGGPAANPDREVTRGREIRSESAGLPEADVDLTR